MAGYNVDPNHFTFSPGSPEGGGYTDRQLQLYARHLQVLGSTALMPESIHPRFRRLDNHGQVDETGIDLFEAFRNMVNTAVPPDDSREVQACVIARERLQPERLTELGLVIPSDLEFPLEWGVIVGGAAVLPNVHRGPLFVPGRGIIEPDGTDTRTSSDVLEIAHFPFDGEDAEEVLARVGADPANRPGVAVLRWGESISGVSVPVRHGMYIDAERSGTQLPPTDPTEAVRNLLGQ